MTNNRIMRLGMYASGGMPARPLALIEAHDLLREDGSFAADALALFQRAAAEGHVVVFSTREENPCSH